MSTRVKYLRVHMLATVRLEFVNACLNVERMIVRLSSITYYVVVDHAPAHECNPCVISKIALVVGCICTGMRYSLVLFFWLFTNKSKQPHGHPLNLF